MRFVKILTVLVSLSVACGISTAAVKANPWTGTYKSDSSQTGYHSLIQELTITGEKGSRLTVRAVIWTFLTSKTGPVKLESKAQGYSDFNDKGTSGDRLIASFPNVKFRPMIVIRQESPFVQVLNKNSRYKHLSYTYYEAGDQFASFVTGELHRVKH
jgi:hypothetical protein